MRIRVFAVVACAALACASCSSSPEQSFQDHGVFLPTMRFDYSTAQSQSPTEPRARNTGMGLEVTGGGGKFDSGAGKYDLVSVQGYLYLATPSSEHLRAGGLLGLEFLGVSVSQEGATVKVSDGGALGPLVGFDVGYEFVDRLEVYGRATGTAMLPPASSLRGELGVRFRAGPPLELFCGYRWWRVQRKSEDWFNASSDADLDLHTDGVVLGMGLIF
jgi:hypothetical protein